MGARQTKPAAAAPAAVPRRRHRPEDNAENLLVAVAETPRIDAGEDADADARSPLVSTSGNKSFARRQHQNQPQHQHQHQYQFAPAAKQLTNSPISSAASAEEAGAEADEAMAAVSFLDADPPLPPTKRARSSGGGGAVKRRSCPASSAAAGNPGERELAKFLREMAEVERFVLVIEERGGSGAGAAEPDAAGVAASSGGGGGGGRRHSAPAPFGIPAAAGAADPKAPQPDEEKSPLPQPQPQQQQPEKAVKFADEASSPQATRKRRLVLEEPGQELPQQQQSAFYSNADIDIDVTDDEDDNGGAGNRSATVGCAPFRGRWKATVKRLKRPFARLGGRRSAAARVGGSGADPVADSGPVVLTSRRPRRSTAIFRLSRRPQRQPPQPAPEAPRPKQVKQQKASKRLQRQPAAAVSIEEEEAADIDAVLAGVPEFATDSFRVLTGRMPPAAAEAASPASPPPSPQPPRCLQVTSSGLNPSQVAQLRRLCERHRGVLAYQARFQFDHACHTTHVVMKESSVARVSERTLKYFQALVSGAWLLSFDWVSDSLASGSLQPESDYEIQGDLSCGVNHMGPARSRRGRPRCPGPSRLLEQFTVSTVGEFVNMPPVMLQTLVEQCGGKFVSEPNLLPRPGPAGRLSVAVVDQDDAEFSESRCRALAVSGGIVVLNRDWLLDSISKFRVQQLHLPEYCIAPDPSAAKRLVRSQLGSLAMSD